MIGLRKTLTPNIFSAQNTFYVFLLLGLGTHVKNQWPCPVEAYRVRQERNAMLGHSFCGNVLERLVHPATAKFLRPRHAYVAGFVYFVLPITQVLKLLIGANLHKGFRQNEVWFARFMLCKPSVRLLLEIFEFYLTD